MMLGGGCIALLTLELAVRLLPPPYTVDQESAGPFYNETTFLECNHSLGWTGRRNYQNLLEGAVFRQEIALNSLGMHDTEHSLEKPANTFRLLMLGDSFVQALQVSEAATAHQVLENYLNQQRFVEFTEAEVLSSGVSNWGTGQQLIYYREQGRHFQPDLVLLMFYIGNDLEDNLPGNVITINGFNCYAPYFALCQGHLNPTPLLYAPGISSLENSCSPARRVLINTMGKLYQHSRLYRQLDPLIISNHPRPLFGQAYPNRFQALYLPYKEFELEQAWEITEALILQLRREVEADQAQLAVALFSPETVVEFMLHSEETQKIYKERNPALTELQIDLPNRRLAEFLSSQGIPFVDLTPLMVERQHVDGEALYMFGDSHWTAEGHHTVADLLAQWLAQNGLLPELLD